MVDDPRKWVFSDPKTYLKVELNQAQRNDLKRCFDLFDKTGSGMINKRDLKVVFRSLGYDTRPTDMKKSLVDMGVDGDDNISFPTFLKIIEGKAMAPDSINEMMRSFKLISRGDEEITLDNLQWANDYLGTGLNDEEMQEMMELADTDEKGCVSFKDFRNVMERVALLTLKDPKDKQKKKKEKAHGKPSSMRKMPKLAKYKKGTNKLAVHESSSEEGDEEEEEERKSLGSEQKAEVTATKAVMGLFTLHTTQAPRRGTLFGPGIKMKEEAKAEDETPKQPYKGILNDQD